MGGTLAWEEAFTAREPWAALLEPQPHPPHVPLSPVSPHSRPWLHRASEPSLVHLCTHVYAHTWVQKCVSVHVLECFREQAAQERGGWTGRGPCLGVPPEGRVEVAGAEATGRAYCPGSVWGMLFLTDFISCFNTCECPGIKNCGSPWARVGLLGSKPSSAACAGDPGLWPWPCGRGPPCAPGSVGTAVPSFRLASEVETLMRVFAPQPSSGVPRPSALPASSLSLGSLNVFSRPLEELPGSPQVCTTQVRR